MNVKQVVIKLTMILFMVFAVSSVTEYSYAYWATNVTPPSSVNTTGTVGVGTYTFSAQWDPGTTYSIGDRVTNNGVTYEAKKNNPTKEPGVDTGWKSDWIVVP